MNFLMKRTYLNDAAGEPEFEITPVYLDGVPHFLPSEVGPQLGYSDISHSLRHSDGFVESVDYKVIEGSNLRELKELLNSSSLTTAVIGQNAKSSLLLTESGVYAVAMRSNKPNAVRFRIFYTSEVMPEIRRTGSYKPAKRFGSTETLKEAAKRLLKNEIEVATLLKCPEHFGMFEAVKTVQKDLGVDYSHLLTGSSVMDDVKKEEIYLEPTDLAEKLGIMTRKGDKGSPVEMNKILRDMGFQERVGRSWEPTEKGKPVSQVHAWKSGSKTGYNLKWNTEVIEKSFREWSN